MILLNPNQNETKTVYVLTAPARRSCRIVRKLGGRIHWQSDWFGTGIRYWSLLKRRHRRVGCSAVIIAFAIVRCSLSCFLACIPSNFVLPVLHTIICFVFAVRIYCGCGEEWKSRQKRPHPIPIPISFVRQRPSLPVGLADRYRW